MAIAQSSRSLSLPLFRHFAVLRFFVPLFVNVLRVSQINAASYFRAYYLRYRRREVDGSFALHICISYARVPVFFDESWLNIERGMFLLA